MDNLTTTQRSQCMAKVKCKDTKPEKAIRSLLHRMGYRFRIHRRDLPGNPDIVLPKYKKVIFVHGCFWHGHEGCPRAKRPTSNKTFWENKLTKNIDRDRKNQLTLKELGWSYLVIWECQIKNTHLVKLGNRLEKFIETSGNNG